MKTTLWVAVLLAGLAAPAAALAQNAGADGAGESGFTTLFNGRDLSGWRLINPHGPGYVVRDGALAGIVSIGDVVKYRIDELTSERDQLSAYIQS